MASSSYTDSKGWTIYRPFIFDNLFILTLTSVTPTGSSYEWVCMPYASENLTVYVQLWKNNTRVTTLPSDIYQRCIFGCVWVGC